MRDIRADLEERAAWLEKQISSAQAHFDTLVERFKAEHEGRLKPVRAEFDAVRVLLGGEDRRLGNGATVLKPPASAQRPQAKPEPAQPAQEQNREQPAAKRAPSPTEQPLADFLGRKLRETGADVQRRLAPAGCSGRLFCRGRRRRCRCRGSAPARREGRIGQAIARREIRHAQPAGHDQAAPRDLAPVRLVARAVSKLGARRLAWQRRR